MADTAAPPGPGTTCPACRFDPADYGVLDTLGTLRAIGPMWRQTTEGIDAALLAAAPGPNRRSVEELAAAAVATLHEMAGVADPGTGAPDVADPRDPVAAVEHAARRLHDVALEVRGTGGDDDGDDVARGWDRRLPASGTLPDVGAVIRHGLHAAVHHLRDAGRAIHLLGAGAPTQEGTIIQISTSGGGVPKLPVDAADIGARGVVGDRQAARKHHGRPLQALCLWSLEVIEALQAEGHPIAPGAAGENLTLAGIDWASIRPGTHLLLGEVLAEVSAYAVPCKKNARWFAGGDFHRMGHDRHPGWSRLYAWVLEGGRVRAGDPVIVEP